MKRLLTCVAIVFAVCVVFGLVARERSILRAAEERARAIMADRSTKFNAPEGFVPSGTWASTDALVAAQVANHTTTLHYVHGTQDALRWHRLPHPALGPMDGVQWLVFMAAHTRRHVQQIEEVKKAEGYPAK